MHAFTNKRRGFLGINVANGNAINNPAGRWHMLQRHKHTANAKWTRLAAHSYAAGNRLQPWPGQPLWCAHPTQPRPLQQRVGQAASYGTGWLVRPLKLMPLVKDAWACLCTCVHAW